MCSRRIHWRIFLNGNLPVSPSKQSLSDVLPRCEWISPSPSGEWFSECANSSNLQIRAFAQRAAVNNGYYFVGLINKAFIILSWHIFTWFYIIAVKIFVGRIYIVQIYINIMRMDTDHSLEYSNLLMENKENIVTYQNVCQLTIKIIVLGLSSFYFGYCLTYFSTFSSATCLAVYPPLFRSMAKPFPTPLKEYWLVFYQWVPYSAQVLALCWWSF